MREFCPMKACDQHTDVKEGQGYLENYESDGNWPNRPDLQVDVSSQLDVKPNPEDRTNRCTIRGRESASETS